MSSLVERMLKTSSIKETSLLSKSTFFNLKDCIHTEIPILNIAFSGSLDGGILPGLTVISGETKTFKTMLSLYALKSFLDHYEDGIGLLYDSEFGITPEYIESFGIDLDRIVHIPVKDIEELKFDLVNKLHEITKEDHVFVLIDSIGNLSSKKEAEDALNEKSVADMTRAKSLKSLFRIVTPPFTMKNIPCFAVNHVYRTQELYSKYVVSGGTGIQYSAQQIFIITKAQEKEGDELAGWKFTINIEKSRYVREKAKLPFTVLYDSGIQKWSSLFELGQAAEFILKPKVGWFQLVDPETGEISEKNYRQADVRKNDEFFEKLIANKDFKEFVESKYKLQGPQASDCIEEENDVE